MGVEASTVDPGAARARRAPIWYDIPRVRSEETFEAVYARHAGFVWRVLRGMGVSDSLVEDAVQDVFLVVLRRLPEFDGRHSVKTWLYEIAYRVACDYRRKSKRALKNQPLNEQLKDRSPGPSESTERLRALRLVEELLDRMDDDKRAMLVLADIEQMTAPEIAELTSTKLNTVYTRLRRARLQFNRALAARYRSKP